MCTRRALAVGVAGATVAGLAVTGCADTGNPSGPVRPRSHAASGNAPNQDRAPQGRELDDSERILLQRAEQTLVKRCMEKAGFTYWVGPLPTVDDLKGGGYVLTDVEWARKHGYGSRLDEKAQAAQRNDRNHAYANALPRQEYVRYSRTLEGGPSSKMLTVELPTGDIIRTPRESCLADAKGRLYGDFATWFRAEKIATNVNSLYVAHLIGDKRFVSALADWSTCMREAGHDYEDPTEVRERLPGLTEDMTNEKAFAAEVQLAVAEATCATETPLADTARALESEYRAKKLGPYREDIATHRRMSHAALSRAGDITGATT
ncbi:hypothetical protein I3F58_27780 [Streptomyces sp. MUM 203J]|nr:hypothetical protein [Streptomyces sp. MUM 203J]